MTIHSVSPETWGKVLKIQYGLNANTETNLAKYDAEAEILRNILQAFL